jgi:osmotically-inducible protein OsmY
MVDRQQSIFGWNWPFPKTRWAIFGFVAGVFTWSFAGGGQQRRVDAKNDDKAVSAEAEGTVGAFDSTVRKINQGIQDATWNVRNRISDVQSSAHNRNLLAKVKDRLSREKSIDDDRIEVEIKDQGTVVLKGQVPDADAKETAVDVARDTEGVLRVEDHLSVPPAERDFAVKTDDKDTTTRARRTR